MKRLILCAASVALSLGVAGAQNFEYGWKKIPIDGSRTGVTAPQADNVSEATGHFEGRTYIAPSGRKFRKGSATAAAARLILDAQPAMADVKTVLGWSTEEMNRKRPESTLSDWLVDELMRATADATGKHIDIGITNFGGIRVDMPQGVVIKDDLMSMFPFKNYLCYVALKGSDVRYMFEKLAEYRMEAVGGVKVTVKDHKLLDLEVGGEPLDDDRIYGVATIDFLLNGGDDIFVSRNARELIQTEITIYDAMEAYVARLKEEGKPIEYKTDGRVVML